MRILLVDESSDDLRTVRETLIRSGGASCRIETSPDLAGVFAILRRREFHVLLLDLSTDHGIARLRALRLGVPSLPIVGMWRDSSSGVAPESETGSESGGPELRFLEEGAEDVVAKDATGAEVLRVLTRAIARRRAPERATVPDPPDDDARSVW